MVKGISIYFNQNFRKGWQLVLKHMYIFSLFLLKLKESRSISLQKFKVVYVHALNLLHLDMWSITLVTNKHCKNDNCMIMVIGIWILILIWNILFIISFWIEVCWCCKRINWYYILLGLSCIPSLILCILSVKRNWGLTEWVLTEDTWY